MYSIVKIPEFANKDFFSFTKVEAKEYLLWFLNIKEKRIRILEEQVKEIYPDWVADYSKDSLEKLYLWFKQKVAYRSISETEKKTIGDQISKTPLFVDIIPIPTETFSVATVSMCFDFGVYFGETIISNATNVKWMHKISSNNFIDYAQPLIGKEGVKVPVNTRRVAEGYAKRILNNEVEDTPPWELFDKLIARFT